MKKKLRNVLSANLVLRVNLLVVISVLSIGAAFSQHVIKGKVTDDETKETVMGVVVSSGTTIATTTDIDGNYKIEVKDINQPLTYSFVGYIRQEVVIDGRTEINIALKNDKRLLEEVVVVGYGTVKKSNLTGAISQVKGDDLTQTANMSVGQMLTGKAPGLQVSLTSAQPGGGVWLQIRGNAAGGAGNSGPLYVVDGFPIVSDSNEPDSGNRYGAGAKSPLNSLNPNVIKLRDFILHLFDF